MKKAFLTIIIATLLLSLTALTKNTVSAESIQDLKEKINQHENEKSDITEKKNNVDSEKKDTESKIDENVKEQKSVEQEIVDLEEKLNKTQEDISAKENEITSTNQEIDELNDRIDKLVEEIAILKDKIEKRDMLLKDRLRSIQQSGGEINYIQVIFDSKSFADFISRATAVNTIMDQDKTIMEEQAADQKKLKANKAEVEEKKTVVVAKKEELEGQKKELVALKGQLDDQKSERNTLMAQLEKEQKQLEEIKLTLEDEQEILLAEEKAQAQAIALAEQKVGELEQLAKEEAERKRQEAERAKQEAQKGNSENKVAASPNTEVGSHPVSGAVFTHPARGPITSGFGMRTHPIYNIPKLHAGVDFGVSTGTPLVAPADGVVSTAGVRGGFGNVIMISHYIDGQSITTVSAHLSSINVSPGQTVSRGQTIGATGNTGASTGPHLHFEVHLGGYGNPVNPMPYLQ
ncbi:murein hydrolase activator EnvC family protein [Oceanobacillus sp. FSL H7-0719]|uniref:murein hydrolase activator EnvC family protein n=1 Tax=Oceanobacillus sp. FSL H7-0719 TaxID=2954507 RepID=UPI003246AF91